MVRNRRAECSREWAAMASIAAKMSCKAELLRGWVRQLERDAAD